MVSAVRIIRDDSDIKSILYVVTMRRYYDYLRKIYREKSIICFEQYTIAGENHGSPRRLRGLETRIDKINSYLNGCKLKEETRDLLFAMRNTLLSGRVN